MDGSMESMLIESDEIIVPMSLEYPDDISTEDLEKLCRLCGNYSNQLMSIFTGDGSDHNLHKKIEEHLPIIEIAQNDLLPSNICYQCASTLISWHELYYACKDVDQRLKDICKKLSHKDEKSEEHLTYSPPLETEKSTEKIALGCETSTENERCSKAKLTKFLYEPVATVHEEERPEMHARDADTAFVAAADNNSNDLSACTATSEDTQTSKLELSCTDSAVPLDDQYHSFVKTYTNGIKYMECDKCPFICRPLTSLFLKHYDAHVSNENSTPPAAECTPGVVAKRTLDKGRNVTTYQCSKCHKFFDKRRSFRRHLKIHERTSYGCPHCPRKFKTSDAFRSHCRRRHALRRPKARATSTTFQCDMCGKYLRSKDGFKYHRLNKCGIRYRCDACQDTFPSKSYLRLHAKERHNVELSESRVNEMTEMLEVARSVCFVCGKIIKDVNIDRHMKIHTEEKPFICELCGKRFKFKGALRDHIMTELGIKDYVCDVCGRKFVKQCYLNKHARFHALRRETEAPSHQCDVCGERFAEKRLLQAHQKSSHDVEKPYQCNLCAKGYPSKAALRQHLQNELVCALCEEIFASNEALERHVVNAHTVDHYRRTVTASAAEQSSNAIRTSSFVYPCDLCGRRFVSERRFKQHVAAELGCELCGRTFVSHDQLKGHVEGEHNAREYRKVASLRRKKGIVRGAGTECAEYACDLCGKKLFYRRTLLLHMRIHSGVKPYKCHYCDKAYVTKHSLNAHLVYEMNQRKYVCSYCGKRYNFNSDLTVHVKQRHEKKQFGCHVCGKEFALLKYLNDHLSVHTSSRPFSCDKCNVGFRLEKFLRRHDKKYHRSSWTETLTARDGVATADEQKNVSPES